MSRVWPSVPWRGGSNCLSVYVDGLRCASAQSAFVGRLGLRSMFRGRPAGSPKLASGRFGLVRRRKLHRGFVHKDFNPYPSAKNRDVSARYVRDAGAEDL